MKSLDTNEQGIWFNYDMLPCQLVNSTGAPVAIRIETPPPPHPSLAKPIKHTMVEIVKDGQAGVGEVPKKHVILQPGESVKLDHDAVSVNLINRTEMPVHVEDVRREGKSVKFDLALVARRMEGKAKQEVKHEAVSEKKP